MLRLEGDWTEEEFQHELATWRHTAPLGRVSVPAKFLLELIRRADGLLALAEEIKHRPRPKYDALILLPWAFAELDRCNRREAPAADQLEGVPVYRAGDKAEALRLYAELSLAGKRPVIIGDT